MIIMHIYECRKNYLNKLVNLQGKCSSLIWSDIIWYYNWPINDKHLWYDEKVWRWSQA